MNGPGPQPETQRVGSIRVGFFEDFKGGNTLLMDVDGEMLGGLIAWLRDVASADGTKSLRQCPGARFQTGLRVEVRCSGRDVGLFRAADGTFVWERSTDGWTDVVELLSALTEGGGHQFLAGRRDRVQVMVSTGEYGEAWWHSHDCWTTST